LPEIKLSNKKKEGLKNKLAESNLRVIKDSIAKLLRFISTTG